MLQSRRSNGSKAFLFCHRCLPLPRRRNRSHLQSRRTQSFSARGRSKLRYGKSSCTSWSDLADVYLGLDRHGSTELASAHMAFPRAGLSALWLESCGPSFYEHSSARAQCRAALPFIVTRHRSERAELAGRRFIWPASAERGIRRLDRRAQESAEHSVFPAHPRSLRLVQQKAGCEALSRRGLAVRPWTRDEAHGHHASVCAFADRLLAVAKNPGVGPAFIACCERTQSQSPIAGCSSEKSIPRTSVPILAADPRKTAAIGALHRQRRNHHHRAAGTSDSVFRDLSLRWTAGERHLLLCIVRMENDLACTPRVSLSLSKRGTASVATRLGGAVSYKRERPGVEAALGSPISGDWLALVSRNLGACDRTYPGRRSGHGRPLRVPSIDRNFCDDRLGCF